MRKKRDWAASTVKHVWDQSSQLLKCKFLLEGVQSPLPVIKHPVFAKHQPIAVL